MKKQPISKEAQAIIRPEWDKMQEFLKEPVPKKLNSVLVKFADSSLNYETSVSANTDKESAARYFAGKYFNMGAYPIENMQKCIDIEFTDNNL